MRVLLKLIIIIIINILHSVMGTYGIKLFLTGHSKGTYTKLHSDGYSRYTLIKTQQNGTHTRVPSCCTQLLWYVQC